MLFVPKTKIPYKMLKHLANLFQTISNDNGYDKRHSFPLKMAKHANVVYYGIEQNMRTVIEASEMRNYEIGLKANFIYTNYTYCRG